MTCYGSDWMKRLHLPCCQICPVLFAGFCCCLNLSSSTIRGPSQVAPRIESPSSEGQASRKFSTNVPPNGVATGYCKLQNKKYETREQTSKEVSTPSPPLRLALGPTNCDKNGELLVTFFAILNGSALRHNFYAHVHVHVQTWAFSFMFKVVRTVLYSGCPDSVPF